MSTNPISGRVEHSIASVHAMNHVQEDSSAHILEQRIAHIAIESLTITRNEALPSTTVFSIPELREKIIAHLDIPDLIPCAHVSRCWRDSAILSYFQHQRWLSLHAIRFLQSEVTIKDLQHHYTNVQEALSQLILFLEENPPATTFHKIGFNLRYLETILIQNFRILTHELLSEIEIAFKYERKPHSFIQLIDVVKAYRTLDSLPKAPHALNQWQEAIQPIILYSWETAFSLLSTLPAGAMYTTIEEEITTHLIIRGLHSIVLQKALDPQNQLAGDRCPFGFPRPFQPEQLLQTFHLQLQQASEPATHNDLLVKIVFLHILLNHVQEAIEATSFISEHDNKNILLQFIISHMFAIGDIQQALLFATTTTLIPPHKRELLYIPIAERCIENGFFKKALEIIEKIVSPLKASLQSMCAKSMMEEGMLKEAESVLTSQEEIERQSDDFEALSNAYLSKGHLEQALKAAIMTPPETIAERDALLIKIFSLYRERRQFEKALQVVSLITHQTTKSIHMETIVTEYLKQEKFDEAFEIAKTIPQHTYRTQALSLLFNVHLEMNNSEEAQKIASEIAQEPQRSRLLGQLLIRQFPKRGKVFELYAMIQMEALPEAMRTEINRDMQILIKTIK